jgi:hypothetical protein
MAEVHKLEVVQSDKLKPDDDIIRVCREILRDAKSGKIRAIATAFVITNEEEGLSTENVIQHTPNTYFPLRVAIENLHFRVLCNSHERRIESEAPPITENDE